MQYITFFFLNILHKEELTIVDVWLLPRLHNFCPSKSFENCFNRNKCISGHGLCNI